MNAQTLLSQALEPLENGSTTGRANNAKPPIRNIIYGIVVILIFTLFMVIELIVEKASGLLNNEEFIQKITSSIAEKIIKQMNFTHGMSFANCSL